MNIRKIIGFVTGVAFLLLGLLFYSSTNRSHSTVSVPQFDAPLVERDVAVEPEPALPENDTEADLEETQVQHEIAGIDTKTDEAYFPAGWEHGEYLGHHESQVDADGMFERVTLLRVDTLAYPIRVVETVRKENGDGEGTIIQTVTMAANHVLAGVVAGQVRDEVVASVRNLGLTVRPHESARDLFYMETPELTTDGVPEAIADLSSLSDVIEYAEPNFLVKVDAVPDDPSYEDGSLWGLNNDENNTGRTDTDIDAPEAWDRRTDASSVLVAVIDTGVRYTHEDLKDNMWRNSGEIAGDGIDNDDNGVVDDIYGFDARDDAPSEGDPMDLDGHGTHCVGTIGAVGNNGVGIVGVAWNARIMACKFLGPDGGFTSDGVECVDYAVRNGVSVISASFGGPSFSNAALASYRRAREAGVIIVAAAGNDAEDTDEIPHYPSSYDIDNIVSVASHNRDDRLSWFSNFGEASVDIAAPGSEILSTYVDSDSSYKSLDGTSMATPHVSGMLAILRAEFPNETYIETINRLYQSGVRKSAYEGRVRTGARANLAAALTLEGSSAVPPPEITRSLRDGLPNREFFDEGVRIVLAVEVSGEGPFTYEWKRNGRLIVGARSSTLELPSLSKSDEGEYTVHISNEGGTVTSGIRIQVRARIPELGEALDYTDADWFSPSIVSWRSQSITTHDGTDAAVVEGLTDNQTAVMETLFKGPGELSFWWRVSTEESYDFLKFYVNGEEKAAITGQTVWEKIEIPLSGQGVDYLVRWSYEKDGSDILDVGENASWVDEVRFITEQDFPPSIASQPESLTVDIGSTATFSVVVSGTDPLTYQWRKNDVDIPGATGSTFRIENAAVSDEGRYTVVVSNAAGQITSRSARLRVSLIAPSIVSHPRSQTLDAGDSLTLSVQAVGTAPFSYQWSKDGQALPNQQGAVLYIASAASSDSGNYRVTVVNPAGNVVSDAAKVDVNEVDLSPKIAKQPVSVVETTGNRVRFGVEASGGGPYTYQWFLNDAPIDGAVSASYDISEVALEDAGNYHVIVSNPFGSITSDEATLTVRHSGGSLADGSDNAFVEWTTHGDAVWRLDTVNSSDGQDSLRSGEIGDDQSSVLEASFAGPGLLNFQWKVSSEESFDFLGIYIDGEFVDEISGDVPWEPYSLPIPEGSHRVSWVYEKDGSVEGNDDAGWVDVVEFVSTEDSPPVIGRQPLSIGVKPGDSARIEVELLGSGGAEMQWFKDGVPIPNANGTALVFENVSLDDGGEYVFEASNENGTTTSRSAVLLVVASGDLVGVALDYEDGEWSNESTNPWTIDLLESSDGEDSLGVSVLEQGEDSIFTTTVKGPAIVRFQWKMISDSRFEFMLGDEEIASIWGWDESSWDWREVIAAIPEGEHVLTWDLSTYDWLPSYGAWVDAFEIIDNEVDFNPALDTEGLDWRFGGNGIWVEEEDVFANGNTSLRTPHLKDDDEMTLELHHTVEESSVISFDWWLYSEFRSGVYSRMTFYINDVLEASIEGGEHELFDGEDTLTPFRTVAVPVSAGEYVFRWEYVRMFSDGDEFVGGGFIDDVDVLPLDPEAGTSAGEATTDDALLWLAYDSGVDSPWSVSDAFSLTGETAAIVSSDIAGLSGLATYVEGAALRFNWGGSLNSESDRFRFEYFTGAERVFDDPVGLLFELEDTVDWEEQTVVMPNSGKTLAWVFERRGELATESAGWLDGVELLENSEIINESLDASGLEWTVSGEGGWLVMDDEGDNRGPYLQSAPLVTDQSARLETVVEGPATLSFDWFASTRGDGGSFDEFFTLYVDEIETAAISGEVDWTRKTIVIPEGAHTVAWIFERDFLGGGRDLVGLDQVTLSSGEIPDTGRLEIDHAGADIIINFEGILQEADQVDGVYTDVEGATSPLTLRATGGSKFFRVRK